MSNESNHAAPSNYLTIGRLQVAEPLAEFIATEATPNSGVDPDAFWAGLEAIVADLSPRNREWLDIRDQKQAAIDAWHLEHRANHDQGAYIDFLRSIDYVNYDDSDVSLNTSKVDIEIASKAGPQLVVPLDNARYALNAANSRWRSLYDALYGTDALPEGDGAANGPTYNPVRGDSVVAYCRAFLDRHFALDLTSHRFIVRYSIEDGQLFAVAGDGTKAKLLRPERLVGYVGDPASPEKILLRKNGLGCELRFGTDTDTGRKDHAGIADITLESAVTAIMDCEDSVSAVDAEDKVGVYRNWLGLMLGTLTESFKKDGEVIERALVSDRDYLAPDGTPHVEHGRSLMLVRNVGHHLRTDAVLFDGEPIFETMLDAMVTSLAGKHDLLGNGTHKNSREGSIYIVKPKLHGSNEVALAVDLFGRVEEALGLEKNTLKMGIMDEERRTSIGLKRCISNASERLVFINTGFLDRTGDEIHTDMEAGPVLPKGEMKGATWLKAYEDSNVDTGLACGLRGRAQIGKGMWAKPSEMAEMVKVKIAHPRAGANCAWVPSPTAATLHALHYFRIDVKDLQRDLVGRDPGTVEDMLTIPLLDRELSAAEIQHELDNNVQGILGYVVRWVGQGVGCSTVPDMDDVGLMEDLATLRISSQHVANWLHHGLIDEAQIRATMTRIAAVVDHQNHGDAAYEPMHADLEASIPFQAALALVLEGRNEPNGYTERILREHRRRQKAANAG